MTYQLNLMENGIDFVKSGIEVFFIDDTPNPRARKYAILHLFSGMLLLLKERLARIRPSLIFVKESEYGRPGAKTINYNGTFNRLEENGVSIDTHKRITLDEIRDIRNDIEHYKVQFDLQRVKEIIGELTSFIYIFCAEEMHLYIDQKISENALERFYQLKEIGDHLDSEMIATAKADAESDAAYFKEIEGKYVSMTIDELQTFIESEEKNGAIKVIECPSCYEQTLSVMDLGVCTNPNCRAVFRLDTCHYCQGITFSEEYWCERCKQG